MTHTNISFSLLVSPPQIGYAGSMSKMPLPSNHPIKVFIADDSFIVRERLVMLVDELSGVEMVGQAEHVAEAISAIRKLQPDVVILDIRMPGGSGIDVLQNIKQAEAAPMVIILTNYPFPGYRQKCMQAIRPNPGLA
jgi:YesN/AraC family two-component response regulator